MNVANEIFQLFYISFNDWTYSLICSFVPILCLYKAFKAKTELETYGFENLALGSTTFIIIISMCLHTMSKEYNLQLSNNSLFILFSVIIFMGVIPILNYSLFRVIELQNKINRKDNL